LYFLTRFYVSSVVEFRASYFQAIASIPEKDANNIRAHNGHEYLIFIEFGSEGPTTSALETPHLDNAHLHYMKKV
jgi:hypothetical protein